MCRVVAEKQPQKLDFYGDKIGYWRAIFHFCPLVDVRIAVLARRTDDNVRNLTTREREICVLLAAGMTSKQVAAKLDLSRKTVDLYRSRISEKFGVSLKALTAWCGSNSEWL